MSGAQRVSVRASALVAVLVLAAPLLPTPIPGSAPLEAQSSAQSTSIAGGVAREAADGWMGVRLTYEITTLGSLFPGAPGRSQEVRISDVIEDSPAAQAGLRAGDLVLRVNDQEAWLAVEGGALAGLRPGQRIRFLVARGPGDLRGQEIEVVAGTRPGAQSVAARRIPASDTARVTLIRLRRAADADRLMVQPRFQVDSLARLRGQLEVRMQGAARELELRLQGGSLARVPAQAPLLVYSTGQRVVLGAEITPLNPGLAGYFGVESGLLVTQVLEGAPAERGGLVPGDVIRSVGGTPVSTVDALRRAAEQGLQAPPLVLGIVREGRAMELRIVP